MARPQPLSDDELAAALADLPEWALLDRRLHRELRFSDFSRAFGFMAAVARSAGKSEVRSTERSALTGLSTATLVGRAASGCATNSRASSSGPFRE